MLIHLIFHPKPAVYVDAYYRTQGRTGNQSPSEPLGAASALIARHGGGGRRPEGTPVALVMGSFYARTLTRTSRLGYRGRLGGALCPPDSPPEQYGKT